MACSDRPAYGDDVRPRSEDVSGSSAKLKSTCDGHEQRPNDGIASTRGRWQNRGALANQAASAARNRGATALPHEGEATEVWKQAHCRACLGVDGGAGWGPLGGMEDGR